jgi:OOP family OmpA-OmpF porin
MSLSTSEKDNQKKISNENLETSEVSLNGGDDAAPTDTEKHNGSNELEELRHLIIQAEEVSHVLPSAVKKSSHQDNQLTEATLPIVEENIRQSVLRDPKILAEALFPVIGPAIRKAISEALSSMVQNLNQTLEHSISPKSIRWRIEAFQTGRSFGEVVMLKTLLYRVEQVFLIHKETGLLLQHASANPNETEDGDMVSAMLTAITDFVHDSFKTSDDATLDSLQINELSVWIESSPDAVIAAVIRGNPPLALREVFDEAIEKIQFRHENDLDKFTGESAVFEKSRPILEDCLRFQSNDEEEEKRGGFLKPSTVLFSVVGLLILIGGFFYVRDYLRWSGYVGQLRAESGIVVTDAERGWFTHSVAGLRDPLAVDPAELLNKYDYDTADVEQNWKPFQDSSPEFILKRAAKILRPPKDVSLRLEDQTLFAEGDVSQKWFAEASRLVPGLFGVFELKIGGGVVSGIIVRIESQSLLFECNTTDLSAGQTQKLDELARDIEQIIDSNRNIQVGIHGFANQTGTDEINLEISKKRAETIVNELEKRSAKIKSLQQTDAGFIKVVAEGDKPESEECKVTFKVNPE